MMATFHHINANKQAFDRGNPLDLKKVHKIGSKQRPTSSTAPHYFHSTALLSLQQRKYHLKSNLLSLFKYGDINFILWLSVSIPTCNPVYMPRILFSTFTMFY